MALSSAHENPTEDEVVEFQVGVARAIRKQVGTPEFEWKRSALFEMLVAIAVTQMAPEGATDDEIDEIVETIRDTYNEEIRKLNALKVERN